ncbi:MAG TPA: AraC family transcriptional regulator [Nocardioidaceae bacterium]|nr:AraC family transcriptional regulator [Nocardioidaceae bacterium]
MDALAGLLDGPRARGAFLLRVVMDPPWSISVEDEAPLTLVVVTRGTTVFNDVPVSAGDIVLARGPSPYVMADSPTTPADIRILPGQVCVDPRGRILEQSMALGVRTWGNAIHGETEMLIGTYDHATEVGGRVLSTLPSDIVLRSVDTPLVSLLAQEMVRDEAGQEAVLDRLLDLLLVTCLRLVFDASTEETPRWYAAQDDPVVGKAIRLIHHHPAHPWTVASLASACGVSRAAFARRFTSLVGEPPLSFLTGWRLALAADLLSSGEATIASVASEVGYASPFALSAAFKRVHGVAPAHYRRNAS